MSFTGSLFAVAWALAIMFPFPANLLAFVVFAAALLPLVPLTLSLDIISLFF
jgi:hypothetical protein